MSDSLKLVRQLREITGAGILDCKKYLERSNNNLDAAIKLFTGKNYTKWGENPYYAYINGSFIKGYYYYKNI